jgi:plastocyanin
MLRKLLLLGLVAGLLAPGVAPALAATKRVVVGDNYFVRDRGVPKVTVSRGTRVKWVWRGDSVHNVKVARGPVAFGSGTMERGRYVKRMTRTGTYTLVCTVHGPADQSMTLVVR